MSFGDFIIHYEHKFLKNIYTEKQIKDSEHIKDLKSYYEIFDQYIDICIGLLAMLNSTNRHNFINDASEDLLKITFLEKKLMKLNILLLKQKPKIYYLGMIQKMSLNLI